MENILSNATTPLRLGILGMSDGNGHPYSWAAIFNGYHPAAMAGCPFPAIPAYLAERRFPQDSLAHLGQVTHVWTQDRELSRSIAAASLIANVASAPEDMIGAVDAVLLARDDAENHLRFAAPFLAAGLPLFVDKPLAVRLRDAERLLSLQRYEGQLFSCSALRYAPELQVSADERRKLGRVRLVEATTPKRWETYAAHVLEPIVAAFAAEWGLPFRLRARRVERAGYLHRSTFVLEGNILVSVTSTGAVCAPIGFRLHGETGFQEHVFADSFGAFRAALEAFVSGVRNGQPPIPRAETRQVVSCIEWGLDGTDGER